MFAPGNAAPGVDCFRTVQQRLRHPFETIILPNEKRIERMSIEFVAAPNTAEQARQFREANELKVMRTRNRDVARVAQHVNHAVVLIIKINLELCKLMVGLVAAKF